MTGTDDIIPHSHLSMVNQAAALFGQQVWYWGQDVLNRRGNILVKMGFERNPPPKNRGDCSSIYTLEVNSKQRIILRGFGVFWGDDERGGLLLLRDRFESKYMEESRPRKPCWARHDFPKLFGPTVDQHLQCLELLVDLIEWIRQYEQRILNEYGFPYRQKVFHKWNDGKRQVLQPEDVPAAWQRCSDLISQYSEKFLPLPKVHA